MKVGEVVPELLEPDRRPRVSVLPEEVHHLAIGVNRRLARGRELRDAVLDRSADPPREGLRVGHPRNHEGLEGLPRVEHRELTASDHVLEVDPSLTDRPYEAFAVRRSGDDDRGLARGETRLEVVAHDSEEELVALVELNRVIARAQGRDGVPRGSPSCAHASLARATGATCRRVLECSSRAARRRARSLTVRPLMGTPPLKTRAPTGIVRSYVSFRLATFPGPIGNELRRACTRSAAMARDRSYLLEPTETTR